MSLRSWIGPTAVAVAAFAAGPDFEPPRTFLASEILPAELLTGPHHRISEEVKAEGFYQRFHVTSKFGDIEAEGRTVLRTRLSEVDALARLADVSKTEVFARAAGGAVLNVGRGVVSVVKDPEGTAKGIGGGLKRFGVNLGRKAKRAADSVTKDDKKPEGPERSKQEKTLDAAGGAAKSVLGINGAARRWAQKLGVDPYTTNPVLHEALVEVGKIDAAGGIATRIFLPVPLLVTTTATVGGLVWGRDPEEVRKINEARLVELAVSPEAASRYLTNGNYTLTNQTRLIAALHAVKARGSADYVAAAAEAEDEREALFFVESAELLTGLDETDPVDSILEDSRTMVARAQTRAVALLPFDWLRWTESFAGSAVEIAARARKELGATELEARISGTATAAAKAGLDAAGWTLRERVVTGLAVAPAD